jgi:hypothetical protein
LGVSGYREELRPFPFLSFEKESGLFDRSAPDLFVQEGAEAFFFSFGGKWINGIFLGTGRS